MLLKVAGPENQAKHRKEGVPLRFLPIGRWLKEQGTFLAARSHLLGGWPWQQAESASAFRVVVVVGGVTPFKGPLQSGKTGFVCQRLSLSFVLLSVPFSLSDVEAGPRKASVARGLGDERGS